MYTLFEESGKFLIGRILSEGDSSVQVELDSGKRLKLKAAHLMLRFEQPQPVELMGQARQMAEQIELDLAWEFAPDEEFGFTELAQDYFSAKASLAEQAGMLFRLFEAPHYFRRAGKGRFRKASAEVVQQALLAIEKKKQLQLQIDEWAKALTEGQCPEPIRKELYRILFKPDKNGAHYKAVVQAAKSSAMAPLSLLQKAGAIESAYQFHWQRFLFEYFPKGTGFAEIQAPAIAEDLPRAQVRAYSIDDSQTTEIDDALSVQGIGSGIVTVGIHIAAPALAIKPGSAIDLLGRSRLSTVYMPGYKITMLPDAVVQTYTLKEGQDCPAVSLYLRFNEVDLSQIDFETRLELVPVAANMRHDLLDTTVTEEWLSRPASVVHEMTEQNRPAMPHAELAFLFKLAKHLKNKREQVRGKPETFNRPDYNFRLLNLTSDEPTGSEQVSIGVRQRGAPLDLLVAEAMILANSTWGQWMASLGVPGIYRSQASLAPGVKVRMGTKALPHAGIGVPSYAWSTSPLRRYTDLVNQWQIIACVRNGHTAALAAPFKPKDAELFSIISAFEAAYAGYNAYQSSMERFWTLQYLRQQSMQTLSATVIKSLPDQPILCRADSLPLVLPVIGGGQLARGAHVMLRLAGQDDISLDIQGQWISNIESAAELPDPDFQPDEAEEATGMLKIAVDLSDEPENTT